MQALPPIVIDTREQAPFTFEGVLSTRGTLRTGDYSLQGFDRIVAVERKSHQDAWGCAGRDRKRFERCLSRLSKLDRALIVIEPSLSEFLEPPLDHRGHEIYTRLSPASAAGAYLHWMATTGIPVVWAGNRLLAERITFRFLQSWWRHRGAVWMKQAIAQNASVAGPHTTKASPLQGYLPPSDFGSTPAGARSASGVIDAIIVSNAASARALNSEGE